jgi:uncharacterized membrane-anchored protein YitT (DUF2179 family)
MGRKEPIVALNHPLRGFVEYALLVAGSFAVAVGFNLFLNPNRLASGGVAGISTIVEHFTGWEPAVTQWALNIPLMMAGWLILGGKFGIRTVLGSLLLPLFVLLTGGWQPLTDHLLLAALYGGMCVGAGLGLVFRGRASTGGLDLAAQIIHKWTGLSLGYAVAVLDGLVIVTAGLVFSPENALYALIGLVVTSKTVDVVQIGFADSKMVFIISRKQAEIREKILHDMDRGLTRLTGYGGYTGESREILMVVVSRREVTRLKNMVKAVDPRAFIVFSSATEVLGEGFKIAD